MALKRSYGLRFVQVAVLLSPAGSPGAARALPVRFDFAPPAAKPKKNAAPEIQEAYQKEKKQRALPLAGLAAIASLRQSSDERADTAQRQWIVSGDGSYTNQPKSGGWCTVNPIIVKEQNHLTAKRSSPAG